VPASAPVTQNTHNALPSLGDSVSEDLGLTPERKLGDRVMREIRRDPDYLDDPLLLTYIQSLWDPLVRASRDQGQLVPDIDQQFALEIFLVRDRSINAFALPGGYVGVHTGLIGMTSSRDELAAVLAHELSHVTQRHIARGLTNNKRQSLISMATMIVGVLAASRGGASTDAANAVLVGGQAVAAQGQLNFSRDMEREADRIGYSVLNRAGFAAPGMVSMFEKLALSSRLNDSGNFPYLRSHPLTSERLGEARSRMGPGPGASSPHTEHLAPRTLEHTVAQAYARVVGDTRVESLRRAQALDGSGCDADSIGRSPSSITAAPLYDTLHDTVLACVQSAWASRYLRDWDRADTALSRALELLSPTKESADATRAKRWLDLMQVQSLLERGEPRRAKLLLDPYATSTVKPLADRAVWLLKAQVALAPPQNKSALQASADELQLQVVSNPKDASAWTHLSRLWAALDQRLRAIRADAESRYALGDLTGAIDRLRSGQTVVRSGQERDFIEASVIDARLRALESEQRLLLLEQRGSQ
jgi:predicted Zn-dependent protease